MWRSTHCRMRVAASDASLMVAIGRFHETALAEVYRRHSGAVHGLVRRLLGGDAAADEITQEIFLRLWQQPERFDPDRGALRSYLLAQAHGRAVDVLRADIARRDREERAARRAAGAGYDLERQVWDLAVADHVRQAVGELPGGERRAIRARLLRRSHLPRGGRSPRRARGHRQESHPRRAAQAARRPGRPGPARVMGGGQLNHDEVAELLGAIALDAVEADERADAQRHIDTCPRCRAELDQHLRVAAALANQGAPAPPALWDGIAARLHERVGESPAPDRATPALLVTGGRPDQVVARRRIGGRAALAGAAAAAVAVAVMVVLGVQVASLHGQVGALQQQASANGLHQALTAALADRNGTHVELTAAHPTGTNRDAAEVVLLPDGQAFFVDQSLPALPPTRTYQLWGVTGGTAVSLGVMGAHPAGVPFAVDPSAKPALFAVTVERAGGVVTSTQPILAAGNLPGPRR